MRSKSFEGMVCPIAGALSVIGDRWALLILRDLFAGIRRYDDFRRSSGVTNATLSDRLKHLEAAGLIERRLYQTAPDRHEYVLTLKGQDVAVLMPVLTELGDRWGVSGASEPPLLYENRNTGAAVRSSFVDQETGEPVSVRDLRVSAGPGADDAVRWRLSHSRRHDAAAVSLDCNPPAVA
ncbi:helix-turn-helix domain-containing protein [Sphingomonas sp. LaA6.9]|uniref:winged helix-turn-helix transcriptional regulator n=1 Tax=Sphingomonas sp. LaA6.9 TaxID=2919914 RepID=UPI001F4FC66C|nr:helix-turn-helix domain-containing protein [Sphingomonas sp. LaA6.9]MCJ8159564.1 helix-turn-helix transcriptional regulator [Sphingomonas sp. LaA6.9]